MLTIIDARDHLLGRLSSVIAKELLNGKKIAVVHCEGIVIAGSHYRNKTKYLEYFQKRTNYNRLHGQFHFHNPEGIFRKTVRRMLPCKTERGMKAYKNLECYAGVPECHKTGHVVVPEALKSLRLKPTSDFCILGEVAHEIGWKHKADVEVFEKKWAAEDAKRRADYNKAYEAAQKNGEVAKLTEELKKYGYGY